MSKKLLDTIVSIEYGQNKETALIKLNAANLKYIRGLMFRDELAMYLIPLMAVGIAYHTQRIDDLTLFVAARGQEIPNE